MLPAGALRILIEEKFGSLPYLFIYALLEWLLIILLFLDGFLSFLSNEIARLFELQTPCLLCTRIDHVLVHKTSNLYCNESICEVHKRDISTLTYCHLHKRLSDIRSMCQGCLLSSDDSHRRKKYELEIVGNERIGILRCSCCGEPLSSRLSFLVPASPRTPTFDAKYTELKLMTANTTQDAHLHFVDTHGRGDMVEDDEPRTPHFTDRNRFFGIPLTDGATPGSSPKRLELVMEEGEGEGEGDIVARLKRQLTLDRRSLMALYMELDEERSASAVAANNAMAMITRLQEEKAAVQMEALQYQRMMEEQAEYDQEAMQMMKDMLFKRDEELKALEYEVHEYRDRYGVVGDVDVETHLSEVDLDLDQDHQHMEEESKIQDELAALDYEGERCHLLGLLREIELKMYSTSEKASTCVEEDEERKAVVVREVALIRERLRAVEAESMFLKNVAMSLQRGGEGMKVLSEIAQHLRKLRQNHDV